MKLEAAAHTHKGLYHRCMIHTGFMFFLMVGVVHFCSAFVLAGNLTVESVASEIAKNHNAAKHTDDMTVSSTAEARGKQIVFTNVLRVQKDLPKQKLDEFRNALLEELVPKVCAANANSVPFMKMGLYYTFVYYNTYGQKLAEITVDRAACDKWKASR